MSKYARRLLGGALTTLVVLVCWSSLAKADSQNSNDWMHTTPLNLQKDSEVTSVPPGGNKDCTQIASEGCVVTTSYGSVVDGSVKFNGTSSYRSVNPSFIPVNNSNVAMITLPGAPFGSYLGFIDNFSSSISSLQSNYQITHSVDSKLTDKSGKKPASRRRFDWIF